MKTTSAFVFLLAAVAPLTASLPTSNTDITRPPIQARWPILKPRFLNVTDPADIPDDPTLPVPGKPILVPADGSVLVRDTARSRKSFKPRRSVKKRQEENGFAKAIINIVPLSRPDTKKISPFNGTAI